MTLLLSILITTLLTYLYYVKLNRFKRIQQIHQSYHLSHPSLPLPPLVSKSSPNRSELPMTPYEAQGILLNVLCFEMPFLTTKAFEFALFVRLFYPLPLFTLANLSFSHGMKPRKPMEFQP